MAGISSYLMEQGAPVLPVIEPFDHGQLGRALVQRLLPAALAPDLGQRLGR